MKIEIVSRFSKRVLYEFHDPEDASIKRAVKDAHARGISLSDADLRGANLRGLLAAPCLACADLREAKLGSAILSGARLAMIDAQGADFTCAYMSRADLYEADLSGADLTGAVLKQADLTGANLSDAKLSHTDLRGANFRGARLFNAQLQDGSLLMGPRPVIQVAPLGSRSDVLMAFITNQGLRLSTGCFFGSRDRFLARLDVAHGSSAYAQEYRAALAFIDAHAKTWTP